jgi:hypothetical protein
VTHFCKSAKEREMHLFHLSSPFVTHRASLFRS